MEEEKIERSEERGGGDGFPWFRSLLAAVIVVETVFLVYTAIQRNTEARELSFARRELSTTLKKLDNKKSDSERIKEQLARAQAEKSKIEIELQEKDLEKLRLELQQQKLEQTLKETTGKLEETNTELDEKLRREKQISEYLRRKIFDSKKNELVLMKKVEDLMDLEKRLKEQLKLAELDRGEQIPGLESVPLQEVVVTDVGEPSPSLTGTIIIANHEVEPPFVIINIGSADGVSIGDRFTVKKGKKRVGSVIVSKVYPQMAVADIDREATKKKKLKKNWKVVSE